MSAKDTLKDIKRQVRDIDLDSDDTQGQVDAIINNLQLLQLQVSAGKRHRYYALELLYRANTMLKEILDPADALLIALALCRSLGEAWKEKDNRKGT